MVAFDSSVDDGIGAIGENWYVTGTVFIWLDEFGNQTTGSVSSLYLSTPLLAIKRTNNPPDTSTYHPTTNIHLHAPSHHLHSPQHKHNLQRLPLFLPPRPPCPYNLIPHHHLHRLQKRILDTKPLIL